MSDLTQTHKPKTFAALKIVLASMDLVNRLQDRGPYLPGIGVIYGPSGYGKSQAAIFVRNRTRAIRVVAGESWNRKSLLEAILAETGIREPRGTIANLTKQAILVLGENYKCPLIIDEADILVDKGFIELVREIHESSQVPVVLVGEEKLPAKLQRTERMHNRVLEWLPAMDCDLADCRKLAEVHLAPFTISDLLLDRVRLMGEGRARRITTTLAGMAQWAGNNNPAGGKIPDSYGGVIFTGRAPQRRVLASLASGGAA